MADRPWWQDAVIYQVYPRSFADADGDGIGDLPGITGKLDYLSWLGVDALWLNPIYPSPMVDAGYDITDHTDIDPSFGTLADLDRLLSCAHSRGLRVLLDFVPNHTSASHPWFLESRRSRTSPRRDWFYWRDPAADGAAPNNWVSPFGGSQWTFDDATGQYYLHTFHPEQPDLNWTNPAVEDAMTDVVRFWLDRGVDGFRVDVANFIAKDPQLADNPANPAAGASAYKYLGHYDTQLHLHDKGHRDAHRIYRRIRGVLEDYSTPGAERIAAGEIHLFEWPDWLRHWADYYGADLDELHLPLNYTLVALPWQADRFRAAVGDVESALPVGAWPNLALGSHDETRIATRVGPQAAKAAMLLLLTLRGTPIIYYGDEIAMTNTAIAPEDVRDTFGGSGSMLSRDGQRTPMQWDNTINAGFSPATVRPWLPTPTDPAEATVAGQTGEHSSLLQLTRRLLSTRHATPALRRGDYTTVDAPAGCFAFRRTLDHSNELDRVLAAINFTGKPLTLPLPPGTTRRVLVSTHPDRDGHTVPDQLTLRPHEACVVHEL